MEEIRFRLNGAKVAVNVEPTARLIDVLREHFNITSVKENCGEGTCGSCGVLVEEQIYNACITPVAHIKGLNVLTIEGFSKTRRYQVLKDAFEEVGSVSCGACMPGMIIAAESLLNQNPHPSLGQIKAGISGNLCRCTGYQRIIQAIQLASERGEYLW